MRIEQDHPNVLIYYWPKVGADEVCGVARGIFHHVWAFHTAFVGPCTEPLVATLLSQAPTPCLMNVTPSGADLFHKVPKSKQHKLTERLLIHTVEQFSYSAVQGILCIVLNGSSVAMFTEVRYFTVRSWSQ